MPLAALALLASCSDEKVDNPNQGGNNGLDAAYFSVNITQTSNTRTETGNQGKENPQDYEKAIKNVFLVFTSNDDKVLAVSESYSGNDVETTKSGFTKVFKVNATNVQNLADKSGVKVYVVCNGTTLNYTKDEDIQKPLSLDSKEDDKFWDKSTDGKGFLMTNANSVTVGDFEANIDWTRYTETSPYVIVETVKVQRAMARFDICTTQPEKNTFNGITATFEGAAIVNMSKSFNAFKSVVENKDATPVLLGEETATNFVYDPFAAKKNALNKETNAGSGNEGKFSTYFFYDVTAEENQPGKLTYTWPTASSGTVTDGKDDPTEDNETTVTDQINGRTYYLWKYCTPSTITDPDNQRNGNTTGIVFKAELTITGDTPEKWGEEDMYAYNDIFYGTKDKLAQTAANPSDADARQMAFVYNSISVAEGQQPTEEQLKAKGFKIFKQIGGKYYAYYYYWNRHNALYTGANDGNMTPMEFGVVRNNVYKLAVTKVSGLGYPGEDTPDPNNPDDPPTDKEGYFSVTVEILPWEVRVNDIEF